ncbi:MAG: cyclic nucleotide-binding domain-containing protein [Actinomycetota bacterium]
MSKSPVDMVATISKARADAAAGSGAKVRRRSAEAIARVPLFAGLSRRHLHQVADAADEVRFRPGATVVKEGDLGQTLFVIMEGQVKVTRGGRRLSTMGPGEFFGEIALLDRGPRTATVVANTPLVAIRLFRRSFLKLVEREPKIGEKVLATLAMRLRTVEKNLTG